MAARKAKPGRKAAAQNATAKCHYCSARTRVTAIKAFQSRAVDGRLPHSPVGIPNTPLCKLIERTRKNAALVTANG